MVKDKNILFSTDGILGYKEDVEKTLKEKFKTVEYIGNYFPQKSERTLYFKILREGSKKSNAIKKIYIKYIENYYCQLLDNYKNIGFDYFLVVAGQEFSKEFIQELKRRNPGIKCILYLWDKFEYTTLQKSAEEFDYIFSFDPEDCKKYDFYFRTSFYLNKIEENIKEFKQREYDIFYIGGWRENRYKIVEAIYNYSKKNNLNSFLKLYVSKKNEKYLPKNYLKEVIIKEKISYNKNIELLKNSKCVLEINFSQQQGLTLRTLEAIGNETKLITTNKEIKNYDFYNNKNIYCIEKIEEIFSLHKEFFSEKYQEIPKEIKNRYTVNGFINEIFRKLE